MISKEEKLYWILSIPVSLSSLERHFHAYFEEGMRHSKMKNSTIWKFYFLSPRLFSIFNDGIIYDLRGLTKWRIDEERAKRREREKMVKDCKKWNSTSSIKHHCDTIYRIVIWFFLVEKSVTLQKRQSQGLMTSGCWKDFQLDTFIQCRYNSFSKYERVSICIVYHREIEITQFFEFLIIYLIRWWYFSRTISHFQSIKFLIFNLNLFFIYWNFLFNKLVKEWMNSE